jgi:PAS domain S-box-containing protein
MDFSRRRQDARLRAPVRDKTTQAVWRELNVLTMRVGFWLGPLAALAYAVTAVATSDPAYLVLTGAGLFVGATSTWQLRRGSGNAEPVLYMGLVVAFAGGAVTPPMVRGGLWAAMAVIAMIGGLMLPSQRLPRFARFFVFLLLAQLIWPVFGLATLADSLANLVIAGACSFFGLLAVSLTKKALEDSDQIRLEIFRRVPVGLFRTAPDGEMVDANPAMCHMLGREPGGLTGIDIAELHESPDEWAGFMAGLADDPTPKRFAHRMMAADGTSIWVRGFAQAVRNEAGEVVYLEGSVEDVTQRREIEEASRINAERFRAVFNLAPIAIWEEDFTAVGVRLEELRHEGVGDLRKHLSRHPSEARELLSRIHYVDVNPAGVGLISAASTSEALVRVVPDQPSFELLNSFVEQFVAIWEDRDHLALEVNGSTVDGQPLDLALSWAAARHDDGSFDLGHVVVAIADVSAIRAAERELADILTSKDELIASVSHELRTPITTILGMAFELRDHADEFAPEEAGQFISYIAEQSRELSNIVDDLLVAARSDDTLAVRAEVLDLRDEIGRMIASNPSGLHPEVRIPGRVLAWADPLRLRQIVRNLLTNARRYGGPNVAIEAGRTTTGIFLRVVDDGVGIAPVDREKVFQPYTRATGDAAMPGSIGLGLPVSRRLARLMGGDLVYRFEGYSVFELTLPDPARRIAA